MKMKHIDIGEKNASQPPFYKQVYGVVAQIPAGKISTYGAVARACKCPGGSRAVGNALHHNRDTAKVPCHRVVRTDGNLGGYAGGIQKKMGLLKNEGIAVEQGRVQGMRNVLFSFPVDP